MSARESPSSSPISSLKTRGFSGACLPMDSSQKHEGSIRLGSQMVRCGVQLRGQRRAASFTGGKHRCWRKELHNFTGDGSSPSGADRIESSQRSAHPRGIQSVARGFIDAVMSRSDAADRPVHHRLKIALARRVLHVICGGLSAETP